MKIIADDQIPLATELFGREATVVQKPGNSIQAADLLDADILLVRTLTTVNSQLLKGTNVKFVGSATAGFDHIDEKWLTQQGIQFAYAPGCNAQTVGEYVVYCIAALKQRNILLKPKNKKYRAGIIGVGQTGSQTLKNLQTLGFDIICYDPLRKIHGPNFKSPNFKSIDLAEFKDLDLICLHTPLTREEPFATYHLIDEKFFQRNPNAIVINAGRGAVINTNSLLNLESIICCLDVWENEPNINLRLLNKSTIATPHIAGYSLEAKFRASVMIYTQAQEFFNWPTHHYNLNQFLPDVEISTSKTASWEEILMSLYNPLQHTVQMQNLLNSNPERVAENFEIFRKSYQWRREFSALQLKRCDLNFDTEKMLSALGFQIKN